MDFTVNRYQILLKALIEQDYTFQTFSEFLLNPEQRAIILRHDVDALPGNSLEFARIQHNAGLKGSYYFRVLPQSYDKRVIKQIAALGHEIGYHYETMDSSNGNADQAIAEFGHNLQKLRNLVTVKTICMHGSPLSRFDNRDLWKKYNYRDFGIIGEPYFDLDFSRVLYLTDTGRRWDSEKVSVRDKVGSQQSAVSSQKSEIKTQSLIFHSTSDIITAANKGLLQDQIMFTFHPQRWTDKPVPWVKELVMQNVKNVAKRWIVRRKAKNSTGEVTSFNH